MKMKNVMSRAWEIARQGQRWFGGNVKQYFAEALRMAWAETRDRRVSAKQIEAEFGVSAREWKNYGKHRIYFQSYTGGGYRRSGDGFLEVVDGVIVGKSVETRDACRKAYAKYQGYKLA